MQKIKRNIHIPVIKESDAEVLLDYCYKTRHFTNLLIMTVNDTYAANRENPATKNDYLLLLNPQIIRPIIAGQSGGKQRKKVDYIISEYGDTHLFKKMLEASRELLPKNLYYVVTKLRAAFNSSFAKLKKGEPAGFPKPKRLKDTLSRMVLPIDQERFSFKGKGRLGINLGKGQQLFHINEAMLKKCTGKLENIRSMEVICRHEKLFYSFTYLKDLSPKPSPEQPKHAGMDLGVKNLASIFILDESSESIMLQSDRLIAENSLFNKNLSELKSIQDRLKNAVAHLRTDLTGSLAEAGRVDSSSDNPGYYSERFLAVESEEYRTLKDRLAVISSKIAALFAKRHAWMKDILNKTARRTLEILSNLEVSLLFASRNLGAIKPNMGKANNQKFVSLPIMKFLDYLKLNSAEYGIVVDDSIDEAYTSRSSCFSDESDIMNAQKLGSEKRSILEKGKRNLTIKDRSRLKDIEEKLVHACGGKRTSRSTYSFVNKSGTRKTWLSDLGAALNHIRVGFEGTLDTAWVRGKMFKLCRPRVIKCKGLFLDMGMQAL